MLGTRIASALILGPLALLLIGLGAPYSSGLVAAAGALMGWEWGCLTGGGGGARITQLPSHKLSRPLILSGLVLAAIVAAASFGVGWATWPTFLAALVLGTIGRVKSSPEWLWLAGGLLYIALPCLALVWLLAIPGTGRSTVFWLIALVWATDTGAYAVGRTLGGPRLAPRISPSKTWAGLMGGMMAAGLVGGLSALILAPQLALPLIGASAALAVVEQAGDLLESAVKRRFGAKDSGQIIPGHGGVLDRLDGLLAVLATVALLSALHPGTVLTWL